MTNQKHWWEDEFDAEWLFWDLPRNFKDRQIKAFIAKIEHKTKQHVREEVINEICLELPHSRPESHMSRAGFSGITHTPEPQNVGFNKALKKVRELLKSKLPQKDEAD